MDITTIGTEDGDFNGEVVVMTTRGDVRVIVDGQRVSTVGYPSPDAWCDDGVLAAFTDDDGDTDYDAIVELVWDDAVSH